MTNRIPTPPKARTVIVGVDTHTHVHVAVAIDSWGIRLGDHAFVADSGGYEALVTWAETHGQIEAFGIEGTGSYGAGLARAVRSVLTYRGVSALRDAQDCDHPPMVRAAPAVPCALHPDARVVAQPRRALVRRS